PKLNSNAGLSTNSGTANSTVQHRFPERSDQQTFKLAGHAGHRSIWHRVLLEVLVLVPVGERVVPPEQRGLCYSVSTSARVAWRAMMGVIFDLIAICPRWLLSWIQCVTKDAHTQPNDVGLPRAKPHQQKRSRTVWRGQ